MKYNYLIAGIVGVIILGGIGLVSLIDNKFDNLEPLVETNLSGRTLVRVPQGGTGWGEFESGAVLIGNGTGRLSTTTQASLGGGVFPWTPDTTYGENANSTSTPIWFKDTIYASSTSYFTATSTFIGSIVSGEGVALNTSQHQVLFKMAADKDFLIDGSTNPRTIDTGVLRFEQTPSIPNTRTLTLNINANSQPNTHAVVVNLVTDGILAGETITNYDVNVDRGTATGGVVRGYEMSCSGTGTIECHLLHADVGVLPLVQFAGTPIDMEVASSTALGTAFGTSASSTALDATMFANDNDVIVIGNDVKFNAIIFTLDTFAGGAGIQPLFEYSTGAGTWSSTNFTPQDETQGMKQSGLVDWDNNDIPSWAVGTDGNFLIRITRQRNNLPTAPIEDLIQIAVTIRYQWDEFANLDINSLIATSYVDASYFVATSSSATSTFAGGLTVGSFFEIDPDGQVVLITGVIDFGGATSFEIPNGTNPTVDVAGEIAIDTTSDQLIYFGTTKKVYSGFNSFGFNYSTSTAWIGTTTKLFAPAAENMTITTVFCESLTGTVNVSLYDGTNRANLVNASSTIGKFKYSTNNTFNEAESIRVDIGTPVSSPTEVACRFKFDSDAN